MSSYKARADRRRLQKALDLHLRNYRTMVEHIESVCDEKVARARHALARCRYDQPVRWNTSKTVRYEADPTTVVHAPCIDLKMFGMRQVIDKRMLRMAPETAKYIEQDVALEIARALVKADMVAIDEAHALMYPDQRDTLEYDFTVYVGRPVPKRLGPPT